MLKGTFLSALLLGACFSFVSAQTSGLVGDTPLPTVGPSCADLQNNLTYKSSNDSNSNGEVSLLQSFLQGQGLLNSDPTGYFGALTFSAVKSFQTQQGLLAYGYIGPVTRAAIKNLSCGNTGITTSTPVGPSGIGYAGISGRYGGAGGTLPTGCTSTSGYSPLTGVKCDPYISHPVDSICTQEMRLCPDGSSMQRDASCGWHPEQCSTSPISSYTPTAVVTGSPSLKLIYSPNNGGESSLIATFNVSVTAGNTSSLRISKPGYGNSFGINLYDSTTDNGTNTGGANLANVKPINYSNELIDRGGYWELQAGQTATFTVSKSFSPAQLFAGSYYAQAWMVFTDSNTFPINIVNSKTNNVTVVGETSPYITSIYHRNECAYCYIISGSNFSYTNNSVTINGITKTLGRDASATGLSTITFDAPDFNLVSGSTYVVQVSTSNGASNNYAFTVSGNGTQPINTSTPTVTFVGTPTLRLQYDSTQHESALVGNAKYTITAGNSPVTFDTYNGTSMPYILALNGQGSWTITGPGVIQAGQTASYTATLTANPKIMFAGSYHLQTNNLGYSVNGQWYNLPSTSFINAIINADPSNTVTIVGETSPYISSLSADTVSYLANVGSSMVGASSSGKYIISGVRFDATSNSVSINGIAKNYPSILNGTTIIINFSDFNITQKGTYVVQVSTNKGASNNYGFDFTGNGTQTKTVTVTYPNGGEQLLANSGKDVDFRATWTSSNMSGTAYVYLNSVSGEMCLVGTAPVSQGYFPISLGGNFRCQNTSNTFTAGQYKVVIATDTANPNGDQKGINDSSDNYFNITVNNVTQARPSAPNLTIDKTSGLPSDSFTLNWRTPSTPINNPTEYRMIVTGAFNSGDTLSQSNRTSFTFGGGTSLSAFGLGAGTYNFTIRACNQAGCSSDSNVVTYVATTVTALPTPAQTCSNLYWFDNTNKSCSQQQFCGTYMYQGLQTFNTQQACLSGLISATPSVPSLTIDKTSGLPTDSFTLNWTSSTNNPTEYRMIITGAFNSGDTLSQSTRTSFSGKLSTFGLGAGTYNFTIRACNQVGCSRDSNVATYVATANVTPTSYNLNVSNTGTGSGVTTALNVSISCGRGSTACSSNIPSGTSVTITASPDTGSTFAGWSADCAGTSTTCIVTMSQARNIVAMFSVATPTSTPTAPSAPSLTIDKTSSLTTDSFTLNWTPSTNNPTDYKLNYSNSLGWSNNDNSAGTALLNGPIILSNFGLGAATYYFTVHACNASGCSANSNVVTYVAAVATTGTWSYSTSCPTACGTAQSTQIQSCSNFSCSGSAASRTCNATQVCVVTPTPAEVLVALNADIMKAVNSFDWGGTNQKTSAISFKAIMANKGWTIGQVSVATGYAITDLNNLLNPSTSSIPTCADPQAYYYYYNPDVAAAYADGSHDAKYHWNTYGWSEGRRSCWTTHPVATLGGTSSLASNSQTPHVLGDYTACIDIPYNMHRGFENNNVKNLQSFLVQKGLLSDTPTGFYGDNTVTAVKDYQTSKGLPVTGMVYDFTRAAIKAETCK